jgi:pimeloyl-ACP methyl ester carboxylesterase/DNA-binding winged helix-turn-helix (wHTH) protein
MQTAMNDQPSRCYEFGPFRVDPVERLLWRAGQVIALTPKAFETLLALVERPQRMATKDELMNRVWPDAHVEETNLAQNISTLRKMLGRRPDGGQYIETVPKRGYRFVADVKVTGDEPVETIVRERRRARVVIEDEAEDDPGRQAALPAPPAILSAPSPARLIKPEPLREIPAFIARAPETRYVRSGEVNIAYQVVGEVPLDLVFVMGWVSHLEYFWTEPSFARFLTRLASFARLILFDKRGTGLSDRVPITELPTLEQRMEDVHAVLDAVGSKRAALCGVSEGGPMCSLFAATYPERTAALIMIGTYAKRIRDAEYPWAPKVEERKHFFDEIQQDWGGPVGLAERAPSMADDPAFREWWATYLRMGASPGAALALTQMNAEIDVRSVLPSIRVPTLILHRTGDLCLKVEEGRYVAERIPGARFVELPGVDHLPFVGDQDAILDEVEEFLTGTRQAHASDRVLATVLFTRIIRSSARDEDGGRRWGEILARHHAHARREIELFRGRAVNVTGNDFLATFDGPARAIRAACAISDFARQLGIEIGVGLHTGECDVMGDQMGGVAVAIGAQVAVQAPAGEVLVSSTVKDLVAGSGLRFQDHGLHALAGKLGEWRLFAVERGGA